MQQLLLILSVLVTCLAVGCHAQTPRDYESELINYLKTGIPNYSPLLYPKLNRNSVVYVTIEKMIGRLVAVDSAKQSVKIGTFMMASWDEERLVWNSSNYGGINVVNWDNSQIWFPVIMVYNGIGDNQVLTPQLPVYLGSVKQNLTRVTASWRREFEFSCQFDMSKFPADEHICELEFFFSDQGQGNKMVRPSKSLFSFDELAIYQQSSEWTMLNASGIATEKVYTIVKGMPPLSMPTYIFRIRIRRLSNYYVMNIVIPLLLLTLLQVLLFFVPVESGEKLGFGITIMLSYTVFLLLLDGIVPKSQSTPAIATFITAAMVLSTISLLLTSLIMRFHFTPEGTRMPVCARLVLIGFLGRVFCVSGAGQERVRQNPSDETERSAPNAKSGKPFEEADNKAAARSDWKTAAYAMERLMVAMGVVAIGGIIGVFIIKPYT